MYDPVPSASGGNQATAPAPSPAGATAPAPSPAGPSRVSFAQALQQGAAPSPQPRAVSRGPTPAAEPRAQPTAQPSAYRPSYGAAAAAGGAKVAASSPRPASAAAAVSRSQPAAVALPPSPPCTPPVAVTEQTPEAGDQATPGDDVRIKELERTLPSHFPRRPAHGQLGRTIQLLANHFSIEIPTGSVYHYDVDISSETAKETKVPEQKKYRCLSTKINRIVIELLVKKYRQDPANCIPAFDGRKNLYTRRQLNFRERTFTVDLEEDQRSQKFTIKIQYAATVNLDALHGVFQKRVQTVPQEVLQAIDIVLRHSPSINLAPVGRSFFRPPGPNEYNDLGGGREVWFGYYTSVRPAQWKPMLNVDMSATAFYEPLPLVDFMCRFFSDSRRVLTPADLRSLRDNQYVRLDRELKGLRIKVTHLPYPRKYKVVKITREAAKDIYFESEGSQISVADYFQSRYRRLSYPNFPCVQSGSPTHPVYIPLEVCELAEGQHCRKKLDESQTAEMIKRTAKPPATRFLEIRQSVRDMVSTSEKYLREFGVKINSEPTQVVGRVLDPPPLDLKDMIKELLLVFYRTNGYKPLRIVFYRDGVSERQFLEVRNHEVSAIRLACAEMCPTETYEPPLTFIVVQKRHHTRFMPAHDRDGVGKCRNVPPGTTVDSVVTHPLDFDFFLCSHFGIQVGDRFSALVAIVSGNKWSAVLSFMNLRRK
ncbi:protein argonaute-2-like [Amblyomma americanum]